MSKHINGIVTSDVQNKTIVVTVTKRETHPLYGKQYTTSRKFTAHDENNEAKKGDKVVLTETRPISRNKTWKLERILERGNEAIELKQEEALEATEETKK